MKTFVIANQKGGIGKSTTTQAISSGLALAGHSVLVVDLDPQGNTTQSVSTSPISQIGVGEVLLKIANISEAIQPTENLNLSLLASTTSLTGMDLRLTDTGKEFRLREALSTVADKFDFCVIDTPPALGILTVNALTASDVLIVPVQADAYSLQGVGQLSTTVDAVKRYCNPNLVLGGFVLTRFNSRTIISRDLAEILEKTAQSLGSKVYKSAIPECTAVKEAQIRKQTIFEYAPTSTASIAYKNLLKEIIGERE